MCVCMCVCVYIYIYIYTSESVCACVFELMFSKLRFHLKSKNRTLNEIQFCSFTPYQKMIF